MPFGLRAWNAQNQIVIDSELPAFVEVRRGVMQNNGTVNASYGGLGLYRFEPTGGAETDDDEVLGLMPEIGDYASINPFKDPGEFSSGFASGVYVLDKFCSNASTLPYVVFANQATLPAPTGYGMAAYNISGGCTWSSDNLVYSVKNTGLITSGQSASPFFISSQVTGGNCFFATEGGFNWNEVQFDLRVMCGRRTAANTYVFEKRPIIRDSAFANNGQTFEFDFRYMIGKVS